MSALRDRLLAARKDLAVAIDEPVVPDDAAPAAPEDEVADVLRPSVAPPPPEPRASLPPNLHAEIHRKVVRDLGPLLFDDTVHDAELEGRLRETITSAFEEAGIPPGGELYEQFANDIRNDVVGYGPIEDLLNDDSVTEVMVNGPDIVFVERAGKVVEVASGFVDGAHVRRVIDKIVSNVGRRIDESSPMVDARLPDGSRVNAIIPPLAVKGPSLTIRKFAKHKLQDQDLIRLGAMSAELAEFLRGCVGSKLNVLVSGGTGSGKTTFLNMLASYIPTRERIVTIEDPAELQLSQENWVSLETRPANVEGRGMVTQRELVRNSLRMRPDRVIIGECRGSEAFDMLQAMNTGHDGSLTTIHANTPRDAISRVENMVLMANLDLPAKAIREQIASAIHLVVQLSRLTDGSRRVTHVTEIVGMEQDIISMQDIFVFRRYGLDENDRVIGAMEPTGIRPNCAEKIETFGYPLPPELFLTLESRSLQANGFGQNSDELLHTLGQSVPPELFATPDRR